MMADFFWLSFATIEPSYLDISTIICITAFFATFTPRNISPAEQHMVKFRQYDKQMNEKLSPLT